MAVNIGPKIGIDGEKQYRQEIQAIIQQGKTLKAQMDAVSSAYANADDKEEALTKVSKALSDQIANQRALVDKLRDAVKKSADKTGESSTSTQKWKEQLYKAETELHKLEGQTADSAAGVAEFSTQEETATKKTRVFGDVLKANLLSEAIKSGIKMLVDGAKKLGKYFSDAATGAAAYADEINTLAIKTGISTDALQEYRYMAGLVDVEVETVAGAHAKLTKNIASAEKETGAAYDTFQKLGISIKDTDGRLRSADDVFNDAIAALGKIDNETERDAAAMQIFGKSAQELNPLIKAGANQLAAYRKEAHDVGAVLDTATLGTLNRAQDQFDRMGKAAEVLKNKISAKIFAQFEEELQEATSIMQDFASGKASPEQIEKRLDKLFDSILKKADQFGSKAMPVVGKIFEKIFDFAAKNFPKAINKITDKLPGIMDKIGKGAEKVLPNLVTNLGAALGNIILKTPELIYSGVKLIYQIGKGIFQGIKEIGPKMARELLSETAQESFETAKRISDEIKRIPSALSDVETSIADVDAKQREAERWITIFDDLRKKTSLTKEEQLKLNTAAERLNELFPELGLAIDEETGIWNNNTEGIRKNIEALTDRMRAEAYYKAASDALEKQIALEYELERATKAVSDAEARKAENQSEYNKLFPIMRDLSTAYASAATGATSYKDAVAGLNPETKKYLDEIGVAITKTSDLDKASSLLYQSVSKLETNIKSADAEIANNNQIIADAKKGIDEYQSTIDYMYSRGDEWIRRAEQIGENVALGIARGMNQKRGIVINTGGSLVSGAINRMKDVALIRSPSKVTENIIGKNLGLGVVKGFDDVMDEASTRRAFDMHAIFETMKTAGTSITNNNQNSTTNLGGVSVNVYASPNHDTNAIARQVVAEMTNAFNSKKAVFA